LALSAKSPPAIHDGSICRECRGWVIPGRAGRSLSPHALSSKSASCGAHFATHFCNGQSCSMQPVLPHFGEVEANTHLNPFHVIYRYVEPSKSEVGIGRFNLPVEKHVHGVVFHRRDPGSERMNCDGVVSWVVSRSWERLLPLIIPDALHLAPKLLAGSLWKLEDSIGVSSDYILSTKDTHISLKHCPALSM